MEVVQVVMNAPALDDTMPDNERLIRAMKKIYGKKKIILPYYVLVKMPEVLRESNFSVQCIVGKSKHRIYIYDILGKDEKAVIGGLAVDIGTTSVAALLLDMRTGEILAKASAGNGQIRFGADVINRIIESTKEGGKKKLQNAIVKETLNPLIQGMCRSAGIDLTQVYRMSVASNTTMNHLLTGVWADPLRMEPYIPAFFKTNAVFASDLGITIHPGAHLIIAPNVGSYVLAFREEAAGAKNVEITEVDISSFIKAKGAIFSAIRTMLVSLDFDMSMIDRVFVAGGIFFRCLCNIIFILLCVNPNLRAISAIGSRYQYLQIKTRRSTDDSDITKSSISCDNSAASTSCSTL